MNYLEITWDEIREHADELLLGNELKWAGWKTIDTILDSKRTKNDYLRNNRIHMIAKWLNTYAVEDCIVKNLDTVVYYKNNKNKHELLHNGYVYNDPDFYDTKLRATLELKEFWTQEAYNIMNTQENYHDADYAFIYIIEEDVLYISEIVNGYATTLTKVGWELELPRLRFNEIKGGNFKDYFKE